MEAKFSPRVKDVITYSREEALRLGHDYIGVEHLFLGILREGEGNAVKILKNLKVDLAELRKSIETNIKSKSKNFNQPGNIFSFSKTKGTVQAKSNTRIIVYFNPTHTV